MHKSETVKGAKYNIPLEQLEGLPPSSTVKVLFSCKPLSYDDFKNVLSTHWNKSSPGINGIPYKV